MTEVAVCVVCACDYLFFLVFAYCSGARVLQHQLAVPGQDLLEARTGGEGKGMAAKDSGL